MSESVEYKTLLECLSSLVTALKSDPASIADELAARGLIPPKDVAEPRTPNVEQARQLASVILDRVSLVPSRYSDVVSVLCKYQWLEDVVDIIQTTYKKYKAKEPVSQSACVTSGDQSNDSGVKDFKCDLGEISHHGSSLDVPNPIVGFNSLDEDDLEDLYAQMNELTKKIDIEFRSFFSKVFTSFRDSEKIDRDKLVLTLTTNETIFAEDELAKTKTVFDVFMLIKRSCSYFNYEALQTLVQVEGSDKDKKYLEEYAQAFSEYCKAMPCAEEICGGENAKLKRTKLKFKLDFDRTRLKPDAVQSIKHNIARCLGIRPSSLYLCRVKEGCVLLEFLVPTFIAKNLFPLSNAQMVTLYTEIKVLAIETSSLHLDIKGDALCLLCGSMLLEHEKDVVDSPAHDQMPERPKSFKIPLAALTSNTSSRTQAANLKSSVSEGGSFSSPQLAMTHNFKDCQLPGCFCDLAVRLEHYAAHISPGVESVKNMTPGSCFSAGSQLTDSGYSSSIPHLSRSSSMLPSPPQSNLISPNGLAVVQFALMHNRHCQIPGCCCSKVRELVERNRGRIPYNTPVMVIRSSDSGKSTVHGVSHQAISTDSDSDYSSYKRSRPPSLRLLTDEHNRNPDLHPHYHLTTKSHLRRVSIHPPVDHRRSKSLSDLTPVIELSETPTKTPAIGGSIKVGTPVYYYQPALGEDGKEKPTSPDDYHCTNQPTLLRELSISADNIPALCLNDCPLTPSPLKEGDQMLATTPEGRKVSFRRGSMQSTKPKLKTVKEKISSEAKEEESPSKSDVLPASAPSGASTTVTDMDAYKQHPISSFTIGSNSQISVHSKASAMPYETVIQEHDGVVTMTTEC